MNFPRRQWFLVMLVLLLAAGFRGWRHLEPITGWKTVQLGVVSATLFCMSLPLQTRLIGRALTRPGPALLAVLCNYGLLPLLAWPISRLLPQPLAIGLLVTAATPCTLASASVWIRRAGGNDAVAMVVTIITNATCFFVTPLWLMALTRTYVQLEWSKMIWQLAVVVVTPMVLAQLLQQVPRIGRWAFEKKHRLSILAQCGILYMVLVGACNSGREIDRTPESIPIDTWLTMIGACGTLHVLGAFLGFLLGHAAGMAREDWIAVGIAGSQKTLMVGLQIAVQYFGGLTVLPMVTYHVLQLLIDTIIADGLRARMHRIEDGPERPKR